MAMHGIASVTPLERWCREYRAGGPEALGPRPKGRPRGSKSKPKPEPTLEQELAEQVAYLKAKVTYLEKPGPCGRPSHAARAKRRPSAVALIDKVFKRILELDGNPRNRGDYGGKAYIRHCMEDHNGQVPLWVLANDLSFGQTVWFFQVQSPAVRLAVAESFTGLYADTHDGPRRITIKRLDSIFNRLVFYRNLCAHDERCYCALYDGRANENVYQAIGDLGYLLDKDDYLELFGRFSALVARATSAMPSRRQAILSAMGVRERELADRAEIILRS